MQRTVMKVKDGNIITSQKFRLRKKLLEQFNIKNEQTFQPMYPNGYLLEFRLERSVL